MSGTGLDAAGCREAASKQRCQGTVVDRGNQAGGQVGWPSLVAIVELLEGAGLHGEENGGEPPLRSLGLLEGIGRAC